MKSIAKLFRASVLCVLICPLFANTIPVVATSTYTGLIDTWNFTYVSGDPGIFLEQITIDLSPANVSFNTAPGGFGPALYRDIGNFGGTDVTTGLESTYIHGAALDGGNLLTLTFDNFAEGDTFTFSADVAHPDPTLATLTNCSGLPPVSKLICNAANGVKTAENVALLLAAGTVLAPQIADADITFQFGGPGYLDSSVTEPLDIAFQGATVPVSTPEPATVAMGLAGMALLAGRHWKKSRS